VLISSTPRSSLGIFVAEVAAQICGIECEHRVLINDIGGIDPPNDRFYEGDVLAPPSGGLGDSGARSTVYATAGEARRPGHLTKRIAGAPSPAGSVRPGTFAQR
jgi:hypothetical protein